VDPLERVKKLRADYERALDAAETRRAAYHKAMVDLIEHGGPHLRQVAEELGLLEHPEPQILNRPPPPRRHNVARWAAGVAVVAILAGVTLGALRVAHAPPFVQYVDVPRVLGMPEAAATRTVRDAGLEVRIVSLRRSIPRSLSHHVLGVSDAPGERLAKGSTLTLYVAIRRAAHRHKAH
jgi:PASTA domain